MNRKVKSLSIEKIYRERERISFPDYQREPNLWNPESKQRLIDSILTDIDIPKLYFHPTGNNEYEVIDGQQRLWAIWEFIDNKYKYNGKNFAELKTRDKKKILSYKLQITLIGDVSDNYLRRLFLRLQLGLLLVSGEKLHALTGLMRDFIFKKMIRHSFVEMVKIPKRRYARQTLCAQICINSFSQKRYGKFHRTRYEDLEYFFHDYEKLDGQELESFQEQCQFIEKTLDCLHQYFGSKTNVLRSRALTLSTYLLVEEFIKKHYQLNVIMPEFVRFIEKLQKRLKEESKKDPFKDHAKINSELYTFQSYLSNAPGEPYQIENRHKGLKDFFEYYQKHRRIKGD